MQTLVENAVAPRLVEIIDGVNTQDRRLREMSHVVHMLCDIPHPSDTEKVVEALDEQCVARLLSQLPDRLRQQEVKLDYLGNLLINTFYDPGPDTTLNQRAVSHG